ncbi:MAG: hypothetical protein ABL999_07830 [Pyrinomonadaceae bacterium]
MSRKQFLQWEKLRLKGKKYVVLRSAVISGVFFFVLLNLVSWLWQGFSLPYTFLFVYPALGIAAGTIHWLINEERFEAFLSDKKANARSMR